MEARSKQAPCWNLEGGREEKAQPLPKPNRESVRWGRRIRSYLIRIRFETPGSRPVPSLPTRALGWDPLVGPGTTHCPWVRLGQPEGRSGSRECLNGHEKEQDPLSSSSELGFIF